MVSSSSSGVSEWNHSEESYKNDSLSEEQRTAGHEQGAVSCLNKTGKKNDELPPN